MPRRGARRGTWRRSRPPGRRRGTPSGRPSSTRKLLLNRIDIIDPGVGASEAIFTNGGYSNKPIGTPSNGKDTYIEWMPLSGSMKDADTKLDNFLGEEVEPLLTSSNGFARYRIGDKYIVNKHNNKLMLNFLSRKNTVYSITTERITAEAIESIITQLNSEYNLKINDYICALHRELDNLNFVGRYYFAVSSRRGSYKNISVEKIRNRLDSLLIKSNPEFRNARISGKFLFKPQLVIGSRADKIISRIRNEELQRGKFQEKQKYIFDVSESNNIVKYF